MSDERVLRAGQVTTTTLAVVGAAAALALLVHRDLTTVGIAVAGLGSHAALCLMPLGTMDRATPVPTGFAAVLVGTSAAIGGFTLTVTTWHAAGAICLGAAVVGSCAAWVLLARVRRGPGWRASDNTDIGYWGEGRRMRS